MSNEDLKPLPNAKVSTELDFELRVIEAGKSILEKSCVRVFFSRDYTDAEFQAFRKYVLAYSAPSTQTAER